MKIQNKMLISFLGLSAVSLGVLGYIAIGDLKKMGDYALRSNAVLGENAVYDSTSALGALAQELIKQKAIDVARQMEIYITSHPGSTEKELLSDPALARIAVQPIGKTGYTSVLDFEGITRYHYNPKMVGADMDDLRDMLPDFYALLQNMKTPQPGEGYYKWKDADGRIRDKYMYHALVGGARLKVAATTYIDEFLAPVKKTEEKIKAAALNANQSIDHRIKTARNILLAVSALMIFIVSGISVWLSKKITKPVLVLMKGVEAIGNGDLDSRVDIKTADEIEKLAVSFNRMAGRLKEHIVELQKATAARERLEKEMEIAKGIQQNFLPKEMPDIHGIEIAAFSLPAREVGGDFYDFIPIDNDRWGLEIADVSGKGIPAALFMALSRTLVRSVTSANSSVAGAIKQANKLIFSEGRSNMFVTLFYAIVNTKKMTLSYTNAGHNPPLLIKRSSEDITLLKAQGIPLGIGEDIELQEKEIALTNGDVVVLYTDGVTEAINENKEQFAEERFQDLITQNRSLSAKDMVKKILEGVRSFSGEQPQFDDITLIVMKVV